MKNIDTIQLGFYTSVIVLAILIEDLGGFFNTKGSFKDGFWVHSIGCLHNFLLDPYYEPLLWFMIILLASIQYK